MHRCSGCGAETSRSRTTYDSKTGAESGGECPKCRPELFGGAFNPLDRVVSGPEAMPHMYTQRADGVFVAKDELIADTVQQMSGDGPAVEGKRKRRRTAPLTAAEIETAKAWGEQCLRQ